MTTFQFHRSGSSGSLENALRNVAPFRARVAKMLQHKRLVLRKSAGHVVISVLRRLAQASTKLFKVWKHSEVSQFHCQIFNLEGVSQ